MLIAISIGGGSFADYPTLAETKPTMIKRQPQEAVHSLGSNVGIFDLQGIIIARESRFFKG